MQGLTQLTGLTLDLEEPLNDEGIGYLKPLTRMENLRIENSLVTDEGLAALSDMQQLEYLTLRCLATDEGLQQLAGLSSLRHLQISSPYATEEGIAALTKKLPSLQEINHYQFRLGHTDVSASPKDSYFRRGEPDERPPKDALEDLPPPPLTVQNWLNTDGKAVGLSDLRGKVVLVNFWGTRISSSNRQLPQQKQIYDKYHASGLEVIGVHRTVDGVDVEGFVARKEIPWPVCTDIDGQTVADWRVDGYPGYYLIDRSGTLRYADIFKWHLGRAIEDLLNEKPVGDSNDE